MVERILFIEGTSDDTNGSLREGFHKLLIQLLKGDMPRIKMGNNGRQTVKFFKNNRSSKFGFLLIDLDAQKSEKDKKIMEYELKDHKKNVFFMIQEMESWFLSQPAVLDDYYGKNVSQKISQDNTEIISEPDKLIRQLTKNTGRGSYHKVRHGVELLKRLDARKLAENSSEFSALIERLKSTVQND